MTWEKLDSDACCSDPNHSLGPIHFEDGGIHAYATCENCGAESRDVFLDGYTSEYDDSALNEGWESDGEIGCIREESDGDWEDHDWGNWRFDHEGDCVTAERECKRCGVEYRHVYVYRYTEYETSTLPAFTEGESVWYEPTDDEESYASAIVTDANHDDETYRIRIEDVSLENEESHHNLVVGNTMWVSADSLDANPA